CSESSNRCVDAVVTVPSRIRMLWLTAYTLMSSELLFDTRIVIVSGSSGMTECFTQPGNATTRSATTDARTLQRMSRRPVAASLELPLHAFPRGVDCRLR